MDPVEGSVSFRGDAEYSEVQKRLEDLEQQLLQFRTKVQETRSGEAESLNLSKEFSSKELDDYELSQDEDDPPEAKPPPSKPDERRPYEAKVPPLPLSPPQVLPQMPYPFPGFPQPGMFPSMPNFPGMGMPMDPAAKERTRKMLLDQSRLLEELAKKMKRESAPKDVPESVERAIAELRSRCERLEADKQRLASQVDKLKQPQDLPEPERPNRLELKQANLELSSLRNELENIRLQLSQVTRDRDRFRLEKDSLEKELSELRAVLAQKTAQMDRPSRENTTLQSQIARLQQQNKELLMSYQTLQKEFDQIVVDKKKPQAGGLNIFDQSQPYNTENRGEGRGVKRYQERPQYSDSYEIVQSLEAKLANIQIEKQRVSITQLKSELDRVPESSQRRADLMLECDILDTNIDSLKQKLRKYRG